MKRLFFLFLVGFLTLGPLFATSNEGFQTLSTSRFTFIYEPQVSQEVFQLAFEAEEILKQLVKLLDYSPKEKIPVIISARPPFANGSYSPFPAKITLYATSGEERILGSRTPNWLISAFTHELAHYVHLSSLVGPAKYLAPLFGPEVAAMNAVLMPGWWIEGLATWAESHLCSGGRGSFPLFALGYEAPIAQKKMWSLAQGSYASYAVPTNRVYLSGYLMVKELMETYGSQTFSQINSTFTWWPFFGMGVPFSRHTGQSASSLFASTIAKEKEKLPSLEAQKEQAEYYLPHLTDKGLIGLVKTLSKGVELVFQPHQGQTVSLGSRLPISTVSATDDAQYLYFNHIWLNPYEKNSIALAPSGYSDIYRMDNFTSRVHRITTKQRLFQVVTSGDGKKLAAIEPVGTRYRLVHINPRTAEITETYEQSDSSFYEPHFSADGSSLVVIQITGSRSTLLLFKEGEEPRQLWEPFEMEIRNPRFVEPQLIWFASDIGGRMALYEYNVSTNNLFLLWEDPLGVLGGIKTDKELIYSTYRFFGQALQRVPLADLLYKPTSIAVSPLPPAKNQHPVSLLSKPYKDYLKFNLWLPFFLETSDLSHLGATFLASSLLGRHHLLLSAAWSFDQKTPIALGEYSFNRGPVALISKVQAQNKLLQISTDVAATLLWKPTFNGSFVLQGGPGAAIRTSEHHLYGFSTVWLGGAYTSNTAPKDFYGRWGFMAIGSFWSQYNFATAQLISIPTVLLEAKVPLFNTHQQLVVRTESSFSPYSVLNPTLFTASEDTSFLKSLLSFSYNIPLGLFDRSIPYGGLIGAGLQLWAQKFLFGDHFDPTWYAGLTAEVELAIGGSFRFRPKATLTFALPDGQWAWKLEAGISTPFSSLLPSSWHTGRFKGIQ